MGERVLDAQALFTPPFDTADFSIGTESPVQYVLVNRIDLARVLVFYALAFGCRRGIWMIDKNIIRHD